MTGTALPALALALGLPLLAWLVYLRTDRADWIDVAWAFSLGGLAALYAAAGTGDPGRRLVLGAAGAAWGLRLGLHLGLRVGRSPREDGRYTALRRSWGGDPRMRFLGFFLLQGVLNLVLSLPFLLGSADPGPGIPVWTWAGTGLALLAVLGEALADAQLRAFKAAARPGQVCRRGLWAWSRHPNYFFEWLAWVGFAVAAQGQPWAAAAFLSPAVMLLLLTRVTGIPPTEAQALLGRGEAYRDYQRAVSAFFPLPPKREDRP
jgi:steroid 5-alpha reductase family enzyme